MQYDLIASEIEEMEENVSSGRMIAKIRRSGWNFDKERDA